MRLLEKMSEDGYWYIRSHPGKLGGSGKTRLRKERLSPLKYPEDRARFMKWSKGDTTSEAIEDWKNPGKTVSVRYKGRWQPAAVLRRHEDGTVFVKLLYAKPDIVFQPAIEDVKPTRHRERRTSRKRPPEQPPYVQGRLFEKQQNYPMRRQMQDLAASLEQTLSEDLLARQIALNNPIATHEAAYIAEMLRTYHRSQNARQREDQ